MKLEESYINYVRNAIDLTVGNTGYPCLGSSLIKAGVADRKKLRVLENRGLIKSVTVKHNNGSMGRGTHYQAYYTERVVPQWVKDQEEQKLRSATEVLPQKADLDAGTLLASAISLAEQETEAWVAEHDRAVENQLTR